MARKISLVIWILCASQCVAYQAFEIKSNSADVPVLNLTGVRNRAKRGISGSTLTYTERVEFLNKHNEFRGTVNPSASDMKFMVSTRNIHLASQLQINPADVRRWIDVCIGGEALTNYKLMIQIRKMLNSNLMDTTIWWIYFVIDIADP